MNSTQAAECKTRADTFAEQGETELAIQAYGQALDLKDDYFEVHANLGNLLVDVDRIDAAISHYHKAAQLRPDMYIHYSRLMRHWKETLALPLLEVRYEALVQQPEATCRELLDFVGLAWGPRCLDFHQLGKSQLMKAREIHEPVYTRFIDRWKNYEQHLRPLMDGLAPSLRET